MRPTTVSMFVLGFMLQACGTAPVPAETSMGGQTSAASASVSPSTSQAVASPAPTEIASDPNGDTDCDRIPNRCDECVEDAEVYNGIEDGDGCPDRCSYAPPDESDIVLLDRVYFARGRSDSVQDVRVLDAVAATLVGNPQIEFVGVVGSASPRERNREALALARATFTRDALVQRGVDASRLEARAVLTSTAQQGGARALECSTFATIRVSGEEHARWDGSNYVVMLRPPPPPPPPVVMHGGRTTLSDEQRAHCAPSDMLNEAAPGC